MIFLIIALAIIVIILAVLLFKKRQQLSRYQGLMDVEGEQSRIQTENEKILKEIENLEGKRAKINEETSIEINQLKSKKDNLKSEIIDLEDELEFQSFGLYKPIYDFETSDGYKAKLNEFRQLQKQLVKDKKAVHFASEWTVEGSKAKGKRMMNEQRRLMLRAFNGDCDALITKVKYNNFDRIRARISKSFEAINKLGKTQNCQITAKYLDLKMQELHLIHEYQEKRQAEIEEQREIRQQMREEERARRELEKAKRDAEKEENRYQTALEKARREMAKATGEQQQKLEAELERLNQLLIEAQENKERVLSRAQMTRSGHVYVISNIGSFGENIYKIGMTRRLDPMDRVKELGDASVPFSFDVHAIIFSEDAPGLENALHKEFSYKRVNQVNLRKEFFNVSLDEIRDIVHKNHGEIEFALVAEAKEYRETQSITSQVGHQNGKVLEKTLN